MKKLLAVCIVVVSCAAFAQKSREDLAVMVAGDPMLVAPCIGSEGALIGDHEGDVLRKYAGQDVSYVRTGLKELLHDVLKVKTGPRLKFEKILRIGSVSFFMLDGKVNAIIGYMNNRTTTDNVALDRGADYFIYSYGNSGLNMIKNGADRLIIYEQKGILIIDDRGDDKIDAYAVFPCGDPATADTR